MLGECGPYRFKGWNNMAELKQGTFLRQSMQGGEGNKSFPRFFMREFQDFAATAREGRPIFSEDEMVEIILPGNPYTRPICKVRDEHRQQWPTQYDAFLKSKTPAHDGTPIEEWPILKRPQIAEMKALEIHTIEQVANLSDTAIARIGMGGRYLVQKAQAFLDDAFAGALAEQLSRDNEMKDSEISTLRNQVEELSRLVRETHAELQGMRHAPAALAVNVPASMDQIASYDKAPEAQSSSLDALASEPVRRRGRPPSAKRDAQAA